MSENNTLNWRREEEITEGPELIGNTVVFASSTSLVGVEAESGNKAWEVELTDDHTVTVEELSTLVGGDEIVYGIADTAVIAITETDGTVQWESEFSTISADKFTDGLVVGRQLYLGTVNEAILARIDTDSGELINTNPITAVDGNSPDAVLPRAKQGERLYVEGYNPPGIFALDMSDQRIQWTKTFSGPHRVRDDVDDITVDDENVYAGYLTSVNVMDSSTGENKWYSQQEVNDVDTDVQTALLAGEQLAKEIKDYELTVQRIKSWSVVDIQVTNKGQVYVMRGGLSSGPDANGTITALDAQTGDELWRVSCHGEVRTADFDGQTVYVGTNVKRREEHATGEWDNYVQAFSADSGSERWIIQVPELETLVAGDGGVYISEVGIGTGTQALRAIPSNAAELGIADAGDYPSNNEGTAGTEGAAVNGTKGEITTDAGAESDETLEGETYAAIVGAIGLLLFTLVTGILDFSLIGALLVMLAGAAVGLAGYDYVTGEDG
jgi:outer membrane protein assembly factor BamB